MNHKTAEDIEFELIELKQKKARVESEIDYQLYLIENYQAPQDAMLVLDAMRAEEDARSLNMLFLKIGLVAIGIWLAGCAVVNMFWGFA